MNNFKGLAHIGIFSEDFEKSLYFYTQQLPFEVVKLTVEVHPEDTSGFYPLQYALLKLGTAYIELMHCANNAFQATGIAGVYNHLGIEVQNLDAAIAYLKEKGIDDDCFDPVIVNTGLNPQKTYRSCNFKGVNGEIIGLYEMDNETFFEE